MAEEEKTSEPENIVEKAEASTEVPSEPQTEKIESKEPEDSTEETEESEETKTTEPVLITSEKIDTAQPAKIEKKPGLLKRLFKRKSKSDKSEKNNSSKEEKPALSQQEMSAKLAQLIDKQIAENNSGDFYVLRIRKQHFLLLAGLAILIMWMLALVRPDFDSVKGVISKIIPRDATSEMTTSDPETQQQELKKLQVRIKYIEDQQNQVETVRNALSDLNFEVIDSVVDPTISEIGYHIVVKPDHQDIAASMSAALSDQFTIATDSAQLSADSDFDAVFILGLNP